MTNLDSDSSAPPLVFAVSYARGLVQGVSHHSVPQGKVEGKLHPFLPYTHQVKQARHSCELQCTCYILITSAQYGIKDLAKEEWV